MLKRFSQIRRKHRDFFRQKMIREEFLPSRFSYFTSHVFILRSALRDGIEQFADQIHGRVLDFGCGSKPYETLFRRASQYIGVDIISSGHDHTDSKIDVFWDGKYLPFKDSSFDSCVSTEVLEHVADTDGALRELNRVLAPGGILLISTPFFFREHEAPFDFYRFTSFGLASVLEKNGFEVLSFRKTSHPRGVLSFLAIEYLAAKSRAIDACAKAIRIPGRPGSILFSPLLAVLNVLGSVPSRSFSKYEPDVYLNLVFLARKQLEPKN